MKLTLIQSKLFWEDRPKNLEHFTALIASIKEETDLIVLPEMFSSGFSMNPKLVAEPADGESVNWLKKMAAEKNAVITGSLAIEENGNYYNRLYWVHPSGDIKTYNKRHLFRMAKEDSFYKSGYQKIITQIKDWRICPLVCYDLRFPVWSRNKFTPTKNSDSKTGSWEYDVLIYVANWPEIRSYPWKQLLIARAIENQCYVVGLNRIGEDGNGFAHSGDSVVINPRGEVISKTKANEESIETISLDKTYLEEFRKLFPVGLDADEFNLKS